jgi:predicted AlkP superfamily phosphohydrolase/phosphomutase
VSRRVAAFVFDSPDVAMLERGLTAGELPTLAGLLQAGQPFLLRDNQDILTSLATINLSHACGSDEHGLTYPTQLVPGSYTLAPITGNASLRPPFWKHISDAGKRAIVLSPYGAGFVEGLRGAQVLGWGSHDAYARSEWQSDPPGLARRLEREFGPRTLHYGEPPPRGESGVRDYIGRMARGQDWHLLLGFFADGHQAGHYLWHLANPGGDHPGPPAPDLGDGLASIYRATDAAIGNVIETLPSDTHVVVASSNSMGPHHGLGEVVEPVLERAGLLVRGAVPRSGRLRALGLARRAVHATVPARARPVLGRLVSRDRLVGELSLAGVDWLRTRAFPLPSDGSSMVRLNLVGREPEGNVRPGREYDSACDELIELFEGLSVAETGEPAVVRARRFDELVGSPVEGAQPDLCIQWARLRDVHALEAPGLGAIAVPRTDPRTSLHWEPGFMVLSGPGVDPSGSSAIDGPAAKVPDFGATILDLLDVDPPAWVSGSSVAVSAG